jgi:phosphoribosyl 1,2-cyclic phosphodiesterase
MQKTFTIRFWGVRGNIPCPGSETVRYGGNTPCVEMRVGDTCFIFDGGTGLRVLGQSLLSEMPLEAYMFFTHAHWDHIQGFPFFVPAFIKGNCFHIYGATAPSGYTLEQCLNDQMRHPNFPVPLQVMGADLKFYHLEPGESVEIGDITVESAPLNHPGKSVGYRINWQGYAAAYITDTEHLRDRIDENVLHLARNADAIIYDATYTDEEYHTSDNSTYSNKVGWGHSTWQEAIKVAKAANVKRLILFHHAPTHDDEFLDRIGEEAAQQFPGSIMAREGMSLELNPTTPPSNPASETKISA